MSDDRPAFVDTNILVYAFDASESRQATAANLVSGLIDTDRIRLSTQVLQEFYVTVTRKVKSPLSSNEALELMDDFSAWPIVQVDYPLIRLGVQLSIDAQISFWDALIVGAAKRAGAAVLYTEDLNHGQEILEVEIVNPFQSKR